MSVEITSLSTFNYHDVVTLVWKTVNTEDRTGYKRAEAETYVQRNSEKIRVLEIDGGVYGMYGYYENPNTYTLSFFALDKRVRGTRAGYLLYSDMKSRLVGKPVIVPIYNDNDKMLSVVRKRGTFIGRFKSYGDRLLDYYSINFGDKDWK